MSNDLNKAGLPDRCPTCGLNWQFHAPAKVHDSDLVRCIECKATLSARQTQTEPDIVEATAKNRSSLYVDLSATPPVAVHETPVGETQADLPSMGGGLEKLPGRCWPLGGYAPGNYTGTCVSCGKLHEADKRASQCLVCAVSDAQSALASMRGDHELVVTLRNQVEAAHRQLDTAEAEVKRLTEDNEGLRGVVSECAASLMTGAAISTEASLDFMKLLPAEIRAVVLGEKARIKALEEALERVKGVVTYPCDTSIQARGYGLRSTDITGCEYIAEVIDTVLTPSPSKGETE